MGLSPDSDKKDLGGVLGRGLKIQMPPLVHGPETIFFPHEKSPVLAEQDFADMAFADIAPARFFVYGPEKFFKGDEPHAVRDEPKLIRPVGQNVDQKTAEVCDPYLAFSARHVGDHEKSQESAFLSFRRKPESSLLKSY